MFTKNRIKHIQRGPGPVGIILGIIVSLVLGVLIGAVHLVFKPVTMVRKVEDASGTKKVYFVEGSYSGPGSRQWTRKRQLLFGSGAVEVVLNEDELNAWMASVVPRPAPLAPGVVPPILTPERINFRIQDDLLQVAFIGKLSVYGYTQQMVVQARGNFEAGADGYVFKAKEFYIGSLPVHLVPGLSEYIIHKVIAYRDIPDYLLNNWKRLTLVAVQGDSLHLTLP